MGEWLLSRRDILIVARHEAPGIEFGRFGVHGPKWPKEHSPGFTLGWVKMNVSP
jgi:hypothetical protein